MVLDNTRSFQIIFFDAVVLEKRKMSCSKRQTFHRAYVFMLPLHVKKNEIQTTNILWLVDAAKLGTYYDRVVM